MFKHVVLAALAITIISGGLGAETIMGPFYFAYGLAEEGRSRWYLSLGASFGASGPGS